MWSKYVVIASMRNGEVQTSVIMAEDESDAMWVATRMPEFEEWHTMCAVIEHDTEKIERCIRCEKENAHQAELLYR